MGIGFANEKVGYFAGGANGAGTEILKTEDAGVTWDVIPGINFGLDVLLLGKYLFFCFFLNPFFLFLLGRTGWNAMPCNSSASSAPSHFKGAVCFWILSF